MSMREAARVSDLGVGARQAGIKPGGQGGGAPGAEEPSAKGLSSLAQLRFVVGFLKPYWQRVVLAFIALLVAAGTVLSFGWGLKALVDEGFAAGEDALLDRALLVLVGAILVMAAASFGRYYLVSWLGERVVADIRRRVYDHVLKLSPAFFEVTKTGEVLSRLSTDTTLLQVVIGTSVSIALRNALMFLGGLALLIVTSPRLTFLVLLVVPLTLIPILVFGRRVRRLSRVSQDRIADVGVQVEESLNAVRTVQAFGQEGAERRRFASAVEEAFVAARGRIAARGFMAALVIALSFGGVAAVLWSGGHAVLAGTMSAGELSAFVFYAVLVAGSLGALSEVWGDLQRAAGAAERLGELLETKPEIKAPANPELLPERPKAALSFEAVGFRYPARPDQTALDDFSLEIAPGERVALVGPSGAGKTTVFQLLLRFYDPQEGRLSFDGLDLRDLDPEALRGEIGLVPQEPVIFSGTLRYNIGFGRPEAEEAELIEAARAANALEFIERLPEGLETQVGEKGVRLSGGQRQRIAIARAILRDPRLLLLDEATSALDAENERAIQAALDRIMPGRTTLMIAHRLATVRKADRIVVMDQGKIVAQGSHDELVAAGGLYARLASLQFGGTRTAAE